MTHETVNAGAELRLEELVGVKKLELGADIEKLGDVADEFRDLAVHNLPDTIPVSVIMTEPEFVRIMDQVRRSKTSMKLRLVWSNGYEFKREFLVEGVATPIAVGDLQMSEVDLLRLSEVELLQHRPIGFRR